MSSSTQTDLKRGLTERPRGIPNSPSEIPKEVGDEIVAEALERHYAGWPDMKLPALDGKTPRQATKTPKGRLQLAELLKFIENGEERKRQRGEAFMMSPGYARSPRLDPHLTEPRL